MKIFYLFLFKMKQTKILTLLYILLLTVTISKTTFAKSYMLVFEMPTVFEYVCAWVNGTVTLKSFKT